MSLCSRSSKKEMLATCNIDIFEKGLISYKIGAPIPPKSDIENYIYSLLKMIESNESIDLREFLSYFESTNHDLIKISKFHPNIF
jgi:hypothetical protein